MNVDDLTATLNNLRARAVSPEAEAISEADTRAVFIEPLLHALGYEGLGDIQREYTVKASGERIDYVLKINGRPTLAVEAKSLLTELVDKHAAQLVQYAAVEGIEWCLLTNGRELRVYNATLGGDLSAKHVADLDLLEPEQDETVDVLSLLSKEGLDHPDRLQDWMKRTIVDRALRMFLLNPGAAIVQELALKVGSATGFDVTPEDVSRWSARVLAPAPTPVPATSDPRPKHSQIDAAVSYWLLPAGPAAGVPPVEELRRWLGAGIWGMGRSTPGRKWMQKEDLVCFYATGVGVVASAQLAGLPDELVTAEEWPEATPMGGEVFKVPLQDIRWLAEPMPVDEQLRSQLDAFQDKKPSPIWSWFVQTTRKLSERDFNLLIGRS